MNLKSDLLRSLTGAHTNDNITKLRFNHHLSLIASGSDSGRVAVWDYEIGRLLAFCTGHSEQSEITAIEFLSPYPIMVTCATDGKLLLWTVRPVPFVNSYICVAAFNNMSFNSQIEEASPV
jgi:WD40 repeat protein